MESFFGMNKETRKHTIETIISVLYTAIASAIAAWIVLPTDSDVVKAIVTLIATIIDAYIELHEALYMNNDFTEEGVEGTALTRRLKGEDNDVE